MNKKKVIEKPIQQLLQKHIAHAPVTILLYDMDKEGIFSKTYKHRYRVLYEKHGKVIAEDTDWMEVSSDYFWRYENNLGMEVAARTKDNQVKQVVGPPGYTNYIGNTKYGYFGDNSEPKISVVDTMKLDTTLDPPTMVAVKDTIKNYAYDFSIRDHWYFFPAALYISKLLQLPAGKIYKDDYATARSRYNSGFSYYGILMPTGRRRYGTYGQHYRTSNRSSKQWYRGGGGSGK